MATYQILFKSINTFVLESTAQMKDRHHLGDLKMDKAAKKLNTHHITFSILCTTYTHTHTHMRK